MVTRNADDGKVGRRGEDKEGEGPLWEVERRKVGGWRNGIQLRHNQGSRNKGHSVTQ